MSAAIDLTLRALADPNRRAVVDLLRKKPRRAGEIASAMKMTAPAISRHLRVLRASGVITEERQGSDGRARMYRLEPAPFAALRGWIEEVEAVWALELSAFKAHAERTRGKQRSNKR
jgi:DNA-binding transcriptional ArsR family regulator